MPACRPPSTRVAAWLGYINLILAAFNLLPASPLDGGRVLHAALWRAKGDYAWATRVASEIGQGFGYLFIALGLVMFVFQGSFSGAWLAFIGWFLLQGARAEARYVATEQALGGLRVRDLMVRQPVTVDADSTIGRFMDDVAWSQRFTTYPVLEGDRPVGLLAFASVAAVPRSEWDTRRVRDTMISLDEVPLLTEDETGRGRLGGAVRAGGESRARGRQRTPGRASVDHRPRASARSRPEAGPIAARSRLTQRRARSSPRKASVDLARERGDFPGRRYRGARAAPPPAPRLGGAADVRLRPPR